MSYYLSPEKPLYASVNQNRKELNEGIKPVYFIERGRDDVIYVDEKSAWYLLKEKGNRLYGYGEGIIFAEGYREAMEIAKTKGVPLGQERLRKAVQDEMNAAKGNMKYPRNFERMGYRGQPTNT